MIPDASCQCELSSEQQPRLVTHEHTNMTRSASSPNDVGATPPPAILRKGLRLRTPAALRAVRTVELRTETPSRADRMMQYCSRPFVKFLSNVNTEAAGSHAPPPPSRGPSPLARSSSWSDGIIPPHLLRASRQWRSHGALHSPQRDTPILVSKLHEEASAADETPPARHDTEERTPQLLSLRAWRNRSPSDACHAAASKVRFSLSEETMAVSRPASQGRPKASGILRRATTVPTTGRDRTSLAPTGVLERTADAPGHLWRAKRTALSGPLSVLQRPVAVGHQRASDSFRQQMTLGLRTERTASGPP